MRSASKRKYIAAGQEVQAPWNAFRNDGRQKREIETRVGKANTVLRELYRSVVTKREL